MTFISAEAQLVALAMALYLFDCSSLLHSNEVLLTMAGGRWRARFGDMRLRLSGKEPCLASLLRPDCLVFRLRWDFEQPLSIKQPAKPVSVDEERRPTLNLLSCLGFMLFAQMFVVFPLSLFGRFGTAVTVLAIVGIYGLILASILVLMLHRRVLGLNGRQLMALASECVICPPLAVNLARKVAVQVPSDEPFLVAAQRLLEPSEFAAALRQCVLRLDEQIQIETEEAPRMSRLRAAKSALLKLLPADSRPGQEPIQAAEREAQ